jgi:ubiquinone/menaquinone biosynthesis C-methylase UbiE
MSQMITKQEVRRKYDEFAEHYDRMEAIPELLGIARVRRRLVQNAAGHTLEVSAGSGKNLQYLPDTVDLIASDISTSMLAIAQRKAARLGRPIQRVILDAEALPFLDDTFDTVLSTLSSCTFPDPVLAFREMSRVCKPDGRILLLEHGRSSARPFAWFQDMRAEGHARQFGCHWNRKPLELVEEAGLRLVRARQHFFDVFVVMEALPGK